MDIQKAIDSHSSLFKRIQNALKKDMISHALILQGLKEANVLDIAYALVLEMYANGETASSAHRILNNTHPNVKLIEALKSNISKDQILSLQHDFNQTSLEEGPKIYIINDAHLMNASAQNALLKFLEEPHPNLYGIMVTHDALSLLPTIVSRAQLITLPSMAQLQLNQTLMELGYDLQASSIASQCFHRLNEAEEFLKEETTHNLIDSTENLFKALFAKDSLLVWKVETIPDLAQDKESLTRILDLMILYLKDVLYAKMKITELTFINQESTILKLSEMITYEDSLDIISRIYTLKEKCSLPIHTDLAWENLLNDLESRV